MVNVRDMVTFDDVEQALVEAMHLWRRTPGQLGPGGRSIKISGSGYASMQIGLGFGKDGPWELADRDLYGPEVDKDAPIRPAPLSRAEVARRDAISSWLALVPEQHRRLVTLAVAQMARTGHKSPGFKDLLRPMGMERGTEGLRKRYNRALYGIAQHLNCSADARKAAGLRT